jgi:hypothetical protein
MKASNQATARFKTYIDNESVGPYSHINIFRGMKTGIVITLILFWIPFIMTYYLSGWLYVLAYGTLLAVIFCVLGLVTRYYKLLRSIFHSKPSAEGMGL